MSQTTVAVEGHVDGYRNDCICGWARDPARPDTPVVVEVVHNGEPLCRVKADLFRKDLQSAGYDHGRYGFEIALPLAVFAEPTVVLLVRVFDQNAELRGSPLTLSNHRPQLDRSVLQTLGDAIVSTAAVAQTADSLAELGGWLIRHFDIVYQRQAILENSARAQSEWFKNLIHDNRNLSDVLREAANATVERYRHLEIPPTAAPEVSVIIPAFNQFAVTYRCLQSIVAHAARVSFEVILVDDASTDETLYAALVLSGGIRVVRISRNSGFVQAVVTGAKAARGRLLFLLNNDCEVGDGWLDELVATFARDAGIGIAGSKLLFPDGKLQEAGGIIFRQATGRNYGRSEDPAHPRYCFMRDVDYVSGAALMVRRDVFDLVGGLSEEFAPGYYEDTDLCFKVRASGFRVVVQPQSKIIHHEGVSSGTDVNGPGMKRFQAINHRKFLLKWFDVLQHHGLADGANLLRESERQAGRRLLFIDVTVPTPDRDAGSLAALDHIRTLQRLGYKVAFVGADNMANIAPYTQVLESLGVECYYAPYYWSVEEVFRREAIGFDVIYVHRFDNMTKYVTMIRRWFPDALVVYSMADIHHVRLEREADIKEDATIRQNAVSLKRDECAMVAAADSVIVHSSFEQALLAQAVPNANVHVVRWSLTARRPTLPFAKRFGVAFIGGYNHSPNVDAALWLVNEIMPLVWAKDPQITCTLIGSDMPVEIRSLEHKLVYVAGHVSDLHSLLARMRLMVAPLRYGAGLKGKVVTSLAAGLPCVATPCALEGMDLPAALSLVQTATAEAIANKMVTLHQNESENTSLAEVGVAFIAEQFSEAATERALGRVLQRRPATKPPRIANAATLVGTGARR